MKKKLIKEQTGAGAAGGTTSATFQPAAGPGGSASSSGAFPGSNAGRKKNLLIRRKFPKLNEIEKKIANRKNKIKDAIDFEKRVKSSSIG